MFIGQVVYISIIKAEVANKLIPVSMLSPPRLSYREVQLHFTPDMEVLHMLFERFHTKNRKRSPKQHLKYFNFLSRIQTTLCRYGWSFLAIVLSFVSCEVAGTMAIFLFNYHHQGGQTDGRNDTL